jgi:hypothetical protein
MDAGMDASDTSVVDTFVDTRPRCVTEILLSQTAASDERGGFGGVFASWFIVMAADPGIEGEIGDEDPLPNGYSGVTDFRPGDDEDFDAVVAPFMDGSVTRVSTAVTPGVGGGFSSLALSEPVDGSTITMVRRDVTSFTYTVEASRTNYDATVAWQLWGCRP